MTRRIGYKTLCARTSTFYRTDAFWGQNHLPTLAMKRVLHVASTEQNPAQVTNDNLYQERDEVGAGITD